MSFVNLVDAGNPVEAAIQYDKEGADELVLLDITATSDGRDTMVDIVEKVANSIFIPFTVGGVACGRYGCPRSTNNNVIGMRKQVYSVLVFIDGKRYVVNLLQYFRHCRNCVIIRFGKYRRVL